MLPVPYATRVARLVSDAPEIGFAPGFRRRAAIAALPASPVTRDIRSPTYLTDLGVRLSADPSRFLALNLGLDPRLEKQALAQRADDDAELEQIARAWCADTLPTKHLVGIIDSTALFTGDWDLLGRLVNHLLRTGRPVDDYALGIAAGSLLARQRDARALDCYAGAMDVAGGHYPRFMAAVRWAAALAKRFSDPHGALSVLDQAITSAQDSFANVELTHSDLAVLASVADNLRCLALLRSHDDVAHVLAVLEAADSRIRGVDREDLVVVDVDAAARYGAQIRVNMAQLLWRAGHPDAALRKITQHVVVTRDEHPYSLSEALSVAGEFSYLMDELDSAVEYLRAAEAMLAQEATPVRLEACRKVLVATYHKRHDEHDRDEMMAALVNDPLALELRSVSVGASA